MRTLRQAGASVHRWVGLTIGIACLYMALTGMWILIKPQLNVVIGSPYLRVSSQCEHRASLDLIAARATESYPGARVESVWVMGSPSASVIVRFADQMQGYFDPCSGEMITMRSRWSGAFGLVQYLHEFRFLDTPWAERLSGIIAAAIAFFLVGLGLFVWWPRRVSAWRGSLKIDSTLQGRARFRNRHALVGFLTAPVLLIITGAGMVMAFTPAEDLLYALSGSQRIERPKVLDQDPGRIPAFEKAWKNTLSLLRSPPSVATINYPAPGKSIEIYLTESGSKNPKGRSYFFADPESGEILRHIPYEKSPLGERLYAWLVSLHLGLVGGLFGQALTLLTMLGVVYLAYSGIRSAIVHRRSRARNPPHRTDISVHVDDVSEVARGVKCFRFVPSDSQKISPFEAGSHIDVHLPSGLVRQYSLCNGPDDTDCYLVAVRLAEEGRGGSRTMHDLRQGQRIAVSQPRNHFPLVESANRTLLLAAGIGITPILSMARHLASAMRQFEIHYYGRSREEMAFVDELVRTWEPAVVHLHVGEPRDKIASSVDSSIRNLPSDSHIYACGPAGFMAIAEESVASAGFPANQFHREYFQVGDKGNSASNASFEVVLARSNESFVVAAQESLLAALVRHGSHIESSCEQGICGSCELRVLSGDLDHRDHVLSDVDRLRGDRMMACVSRCRGKLVVDA